MVIARYSISNGLSGCFMPDNVGGPYAFATRRELADFIRTEIDYLDWPASMFGEVKIRRLWSFIVNAKSASSAHFSLQRGGYELAFHGLTREEFDAMEAENGE